MADVYLSLGSNIEKRTENLNKALFFLENEFGKLNVSYFYETEPVDYEKQPNFINCCVFFESEKTVFEIFETAKKIQEKMGQGEKKIRFGPRTIDIDIIFYSDEIIDLPDLKIPHERMHERAFVLFPLMDINENFVHPVFKKSVKKLSEEKKVLSQGIKKYLKD
ncbi:MAG: 2-amino-4-hydroxy-6-hydroxymethyldihydropteridine diphosphokinase [Desulfobacteraceae bacterium]|nr:2-amino-4-hydroxy-6-hydroxymethyldihydropteridine diphosphokinase [Desulfobacteraceae bacterium]MCB9495138.1 2-amino-4-hydroxy-6-hydroxymethyldihydropteridine diphosphokinase [Desulfobacteraceae bacterium]